MVTSGYFLSHHPLKFWLKYLVSACCVVWHLLVVRCCCLVGDPIGELQGSQLDCLFVAFVCLLVCLASPGCEVLLFGGWEIQ